MMERTSYVSERSSPTVKLGAGGGDEVRDRQSEIQHRSIGRRTPAIA